MVNLIKKQIKKRRAKGVECMKDLSVVICSTVRDCNKQLQRNIPVINSLRSYFKNSSVVIVENDSKDGTKETLLQWQADHTSIVLLGEDTYQNTIPRQKEVQVNPAYSRKRIEKMCAFRNLYLDHIKGMNDLFDYVIIIDLDVHKISIDGILDSFGQDLAWDSISANGKKFVFSKCTTLFHDTYALKEVGEYMPQTEQSIYGNRVKWNCLKKGMPLIPVQSGFNGLGIYRYETIKECTYLCEDNNDSRVEVCCEHVSIHKQMIRLGYDKIFVNPSLLVIYREKMRDLLKWLC